VEIIIVSLAAFIASALTLFSGFGLGTLLMPVVAIFFPITIAISITAIVHLANNLFKAVLLGQYADRSVLLRFGIPAVIFAFLGAIILGWLSTIPPLYEYSAFNQNLKISPAKLIVGLLILGFVALELSPKYSTVKIDPKYLPFGGVISGFFGGLSGHQGAFRSMFLIKSGLSKEAYVATGVMLAVMVDVARLSIYGWQVATEVEQIQWRLVFAASISAFFGAYFGAKLLKKITINVIRMSISIMLVIVAIGLILGVF
jgi:uncharacterized protein